MKSGDEMKKRFKLQKSMVVGLNALTKSEQKILDVLKRIYVSFWDDNYYYNPI